MPLPIEKITGFTTLVVGYLTNNKTQIIAGDYDPTDDIAELPVAAAALTTANQAQESNKSGQKMKTQEQDQVFADSYTKASGSLDAAVGLIGKTSVEGKEGLKLRSNLQGQRTDPGQLIGFINSVGAYLEKYRTQLEAKNMTVTSAKAKLATAAAAVSTAQGSQESAKTTRGQSTTTVEQIAKALYDRTSGCLDAAVGAVGKTSAIGKEGLEIRARIRREAGGDQPPAPPTPPPPPPLP